MVGSPRSGSTWLLRLLVYPWGVGQTPTGIDPSRWLPAGPDAVPVNESYLPLHLGPLRDVTVAPEEVDSARLLLNDQRGADPSYFFSEEYRDVWSEGVRRLTLERFGAQVDRAVAEHGMTDPLVLIKEPNGSHAADVVARLLPRCRMIFLLRDGRDVVDSMLEADSPGGWRTNNEGVRVLATPEERLEAIRRQAYLWLVRTVSVERACAALGPDPAGSRSATRSCSATPRASSRGCRAGSGSTGRRSRSAARRTQTASARSATACAAAARAFAPPPRASGART